VTRTHHYLKTLLECLHAEGEEKAEGLLLLLEALADLVQAFVDVDPQARQHLLLRHVQCLGMTVATIPAEKSTIFNR
jgi:hypothetical protein